MFGLARRSLLVVALVVTCFVTACGYHIQGADAPIRLDEQYRDLAITEVENPTLDTWLEPALRSLLRDELSKRGQITWVSRSKATGLVKLDVVRFGSSSMVKGAEDQTLKYQIKLILNCRIVAAEDGSLLWDSGAVDMQQSYYEGGRDKAERLAVELAVREVADRLSQAY